jgi:hypothetical protein
MSAGVRWQALLVRACFSLCPLLLALAWPTADAGAVLISSGDGTGNTTAPNDDFGFANVGTAGQSAVYLGNGWVITANHVVVGPVTLAGRVFAPVPDTHRRLRNPGPGVSADLAVFRLQDPPPDLPALTIRRTPPAIGDEVVLVGNGPDRGEPVEIGDLRGFAWLPSTSLRWGTNRVVASDVPVQVGRGDFTSAFAMRFDRALPTPHEAQVGTGDSGGGAFIRNGGVWELAGVLFAANHLEGQPKQTSVYGNLTFSVDLSAYREQILALTSAPACDNGFDDDGDGLVDSADPDCAGPNGTSEAPPGAVGGEALPEAPAPAADPDPACGRGWPFVLVIPLFWLGGRCAGRLRRRGARPPGPQA